jgi:hypothetical protein
MTWERVNIVDSDGLSGGIGFSADSALRFDTNTSRHALKRTKDEFFVLRLPKIETTPVKFWNSVIKPRAYVGKVGD